MTDQSSTDRLDSLERSLFGAAQAGSLSQRLSKLHTRLDTMPGLSKAAAINTNEKKNEGATIGTSKEQGQSSTNKEPNGGLKTETAVAESPQKSRLLNGRIEQITSGKTPTLANATQIRTGKILQSFPVAFQGTWAGVAQIDQFEYAQSNDPSLNAVSQREQGLMYRGRQGQLQVQFSADSTGRTATATSVIAFTRTASDARYLDMVSAGGAGAVPVTKFLVKFGTVRNEKNITGLTISATERSNKITQLTPNVVEQVIETRTDATDPVSGRTSYAWKESVIRLYETGPNQMQAQLATVLYGSNGDYLHKEVYHGVVTRVDGAWQR
ncbi:MAG TPA: hypothetical protein V6C86_14705 [Oculatellaceae cyanobacterium]